LAVGAWAWSVRDFAEATEMLYEHGTLDTRLPFAELRARSRINVQAKALDQDPEFSRLIREVLPDPRSPATPGTSR